MDADAPRGGLPMPPEALVAHAGFVRRLAGALLRDDADADDAAQEALVAGVAGGPSAERARAAWLATVVRRVVARMRRTATRRDTRETRAARPEATPAADEMAAREETLRAVVAAIRRLEAPAREVVLLRHYDDLPPRVIAERLGVPLETVKSRLRRAHERLRVLLEREGPEESARRRKALAGFAGRTLAPQATPGTAAPLVAKGATHAMGGKPVAVAALVVLAAGAGLWAVTDRTGGQRGDDRAALGASTATEAESASAPTPPALAARPTGAAAAAASPSDEPLPEGWVRRTVGDLEIGVPREWVERALGPGEVAWTATPAPGDAGWDFEVRRRFDVAYFLERNQVLASGPRLVGGRAATWRTGRVTIMMSDPGEFLLVTLDDAEGSPPVFLSLVKRPLQVAERRAVFDRVLDSVRFPGAVGEVAGVELGEHEVGELRRQAVRPAGGVDVLVVRGDRPLPGAVVELHARDEAGPWISIATDDRGEIRVPEAAARTTQVAVRADGVSERWWRGSASELRSRMVCVLGLRSLEGRAFDAAGRPLAGASVWLYPRTGQKWAARTVADADGTFALRGLVAGDYALFAFNRTPGPDVAPVRSESVSIRKSAAAVHVDLGSDAPDAAWRFAVRWRSGSPAGAGTLLWLARDESGASTRRVEVGPDGRATVVIPPGRWRASVGRAATWVTIGGASGETTWTAPGVRVTGRVEGLPPDDLATVECRTSPASDPTFSARVSDGVFAMEGVEPGPHLLLVRVADRTSPPREIVVPEDRDLDGLVLEAP